MENSNYFSNDAPIGNEAEANLLNTRYLGNTDYLQMYLAFEALENCAFSFKRTGTTADIYYSIDNGNTWTVLVSGESTPVVTIGNKILWKSDRTSDIFSDKNYITFASTNQFSIEGNIMSLLYGDNFIEQIDLINTHAFYSLFEGNTTLVNAQNLILPSTTLTTQCYVYMFKGCTSLTTAPELPATTLADSCYGAMFEGCTNLITVPTLPATILATQCYYGMFCDCTSLTIAPELPATTLVDWCYGNMFEGCTSLNKITCLATNISASNCTTNWVSDISSTGTFVKSSSMSSWTTDINGIPSGWTVVDA